MSISSRITEGNPHGELLPEHGELLPEYGDPIPLIRSPLRIGRRSSCDICVHFPGIAGLHCELVFKDGYWFVRSLDSVEGVKINGMSVVASVLHPGDEITIGKRKYTIRYTQFRTPQ